MNSEIYSFIISLDVLQSRTTTASQRLSNHLEASILYSAHCEYGIDLSTLILAEQGELGKGPFSCGVIVRATCGIAIQQATTELD